MTRRQTGNMDFGNQSTDRRFHQLGRIIATLELGARAHGEIRWLHLYYPGGFLPHAGLREPLQKHLQSVLPALQRRGTSTSSARASVRFFQRLAHRLPTDALEDLPFHQSVRQQF